MESGELPELLAAGSVGAACGECAIYLGASPELGAVVGIVIVVFGRPVVRHLVARLRPMLDRWDAWASPGKPNDDDDPA